MGLTAGNATRLHDGRAIIRANTKNVLHFSRNVIVLSDIALPNDNCSPPQLSERPLVDLVPRCIPIQLFQPEFTPVGWCRAILAPLVPMPEAAVDEDDGFVFRQDDVRFAGQGFDMQAKTVTHPME